MCGLYVDNGLCVAFSARHQRAIYPQQNEQERQQNTSILWVTCDKLTLCYR